MGKWKKTACLLLVALTAFFGFPAKSAQASSYIKWVDCNVKQEVLNKVYELDVRYRGTGTEFRFSEVLAYLALKNGNNFSGKSDLANLAQLAKKLEGGERLSEVYGENKYFRYYTESFSAIFDGFFGEYTVDGGEVKYGLTAYFPFAKGYWYNHYDDFGSSRSFGFKRKHTGHDLMGGIGTPIVAVEGGTITEFGWNRYGGWRIGIRTEDTKRYYYYAHLRKDRPYCENLKKGDRVCAGQVIGYLGNTGYSSKENQNLKSGQPHLHFGMQLIFDETQVQGNHEIWIDVYEICKFLTQLRAQVTKNAETKEYKSVGLRERTEGKPMPRLPDTGEQEES